MQEETFLDENDYTLCCECHCSIQPYNNASIAHITSSISAAGRPAQLVHDLLKSSHPYITTLLSYNALHCHKCGLYIRIHGTQPRTTVEDAKIFICSHPSHPHPYCLCYHCGLLYGVNPSQNQSIDVLQQVQYHLKNTSEGNKENTPTIGLNEKAVSFDEGSPEVDEDGDHSVEHDEDLIQIDESYQHLQQLQNRLHSLSQTCPSSPHGPRGASNRSNVSSRISQSLQGSPLLGPAEPSPMVLARDMDESQKQWQQYLMEQQKSSRSASRLLSSREARADSSTKCKLEKQQRSLETLQKLKKQLEQQKKQSQNFANLFKNGIYSKEKTIKKKLHTAGLKLNA